MALALEPLFFKKKLTVIGIIGHTQGVSKARKPPTKPAMNMYKYDWLELLPSAPKTLSSSITGTHKSELSVCNVLCDTIFVESIVALSFVCPSFGRMSVFVDLDASDVD